MKVGVIGVGAVGSACRKGFELLGHDVKVHDPKFNSKIEDIIRLSALPGNYIHIYLRDSSQEKNTDKTELSQI